MTCQYKKCNSDSEHIYYFPQDTKMNQDLGTHQFKPSVELGEIPSKVSTKLLLQSQ